MILVIERDPDHPGRRITRVVLDEPGEFPPKSMLDVRVELRKALDDLPGDIRGLTICPCPKRRKDDKRDQEQGEKRP